MWSVDYVPVLAADLVCTHAGTIPMTYQVLLHKEEGSAVVKSLISPSDDDTCGIVRVQPETSSQWKR